jgi:hypothetical protein
MLFLAKIKSSRFKPYFSIEIRPLSFITIKQKWQF